MNLRRLRPLDLWVIGEASSGPICQVRHDLGYQYPEVLHDLKAKLKAWEAEMDASDRDFVVR